MVLVSRRMWPGINRPGGVGKVARLHLSPSGRLEALSVRYPVECYTEKDIPLAFIQPHGFSLDGRRGTLRCARCGSFVRDCGDCDAEWLREEERKRAEREAQERRAAEQAALAASAAPSPAAKPPRGSKHRRRSRPGASPQAPAGPSLFRRYREAAASTNPSDFLSGSSGDERAEPAPAAAGGEGDGSDDTDDLLEMAEWGEEGEDDADDADDDDASRSSHSSASHSSHSSHSSHPPTLSPPSPPSPSASQLDPDSNFLQPEGYGAAQRLPSELSDPTRTIPFASLPSYFDSLHSSLSSSALPSCKLKLITSPPSPPLWYSFLSSLVHSGLDLLRASLKRLQKPSLYRPHVRSLGLDRSRWRAAMEVRDIRLDQLIQEVESFMREAKLKLLPPLPLAEEEASGSEGDDPDNDYSFSQLPPSPPPSPIPAADPLQALPDLPAHPHASTKPKPPGRWRREERELAAHAIRCFDAGSLPGGVAGETTLGGYLGDLLRCEPGKVLGKFRGRGGDAGRTYGGGEPGPEEREEMERLKRKWRRKVEGKKKKRRARKKREASSGSEGGGKRKRRDGVSSGSEDFEAGWGATKKERRRGLGPDRSGASKERRRQQKQRPPGSDSDMSLENAPPAQQRPPSPPAGGRGWEKPKNNAESSSARMERFLAANAAEGSIDAFLAPAPKPGAPPPPKSRLDGMFENPDKNKNFWKTTAGRRSKSVAPPLPPPPPQTT
ncbi:hypothetical protein TeGR_g13063, partial [Tetraparma gracilis]